jgi:ABC-type uncharacterized transport system substrate-binding protein
MRRRDFVGLLGGVAAWPVAVARAQQDGRVRQVGVLTLASSTTPGVLATLREELRKLGWREGLNLRIDVRIADDAAALPVAAGEVVKSAPEVIFTLFGPVARAAQMRTRTIPIVFVGGGEASGMVRNVARPQGNATGFANNFSSLGGKWMELLKEAAPGVARVAILSPPELLLTSGTVAIGSIEAAAKQLGTTTIRTPFRNSAEIESAVEAFAAESNGALILVGPNPGAVAFGTIQRLALMRRLPLVYQSTGEGVLISYATDVSDLVRGAASYVDRILRGTKPGDLPVQFPTRFKLVVNLKAAKAIGLTVPESMLVRADEVIE